MSIIRWPSSGGACSLPLILEHWAERNPERLFLRDATQTEEVDFSFERSLAATERLARGLSQLRIGKGDVVAILAQNSAFLVHAIFAVQRCGGISVVLYPPGVTRSEGIFGAQLREQLVCCKARALVVASEFYTEPWVPTPKSVPGLEHVASEAFLLEADDHPLPERQLDTHAIAHLQFTSGSTGRQRGVALMNRHLVDNAFCIAEGMRQSESDRLVSWLPLAHDMGLIGGVLMPLVKNYPVWLMRPNHFLLRPVKWLRAISDFGGTITFAPNFGYQRCVTAIQERDVHGLNLESLRVAVCAAEPVLKDTLLSFERRFAQHGLARGVLRPAYGLAENTVGATTSEVGQDARFETLSYAALTSNSVAVEARPGEPSVTVACVGRAFPGVEVSIVADDGTPLPERQVGEVVLSGRMVAAGYVGDEQASQRTFRDGLLYTGDCGYLADGELYVAGRKKELIIHAGKNYFPQDLEVAVEALAGVERAVAFGSLSKKSGTEEIVVWVGTKARGNEREDALVESCRRAVLDALGVSIDEVVLVHPTNIPKTTSGKLRRAECRRAHEHARGGVA